MLSQEIRCPNCQWRTVCGSADLAIRLRLIGLLRRDKEPSDEILIELLNDAAPRMTCPTCKQIGLVANDAVEENDDWDDDDWQAATLCDLCRQPIPPERQEALPETRRCVACQGKTESGEDTVDEPEFCPNCGSLVELRVSRGGGLTRYRRFCTGIPSCRL